MFNKKAVSLVVCLLLGLGCTPVHTRMTKRIIVPASADKSIFIQVDSDKPEMALIIKPLEEQLASKNYRVVDALGQASYILHLDLVAFGLHGSPPRTSSGSASGVMSSAGTAIGGAASGNALHAATTTGGAIGGLAGLGLGLLSRGPRGVPFIGKIKVGISESAQQIDQETVITAMARVYKDRQVTAVRQAVAQKLAVKIAGLLP